jgi:Iap family predicted aminopeptidase
MKNYQSFDLLEKMAYVRTGGSKEELQCAEFIKKEVEKQNVSAEIVPFEIDGYTIKNARLIVDGNEIECAGVGMSGSTAHEGITAPITYVTSIQDAKLQDLEGKIALVHSKLVNVKIYKTLCEKKALGLIVCTGSVYLENENVDLDPYQLRDRHLTNGKIPAVCIRMKDAENLLKLNSKEATLIIEQEEAKINSHNVVATIEGSKYPNEVVVFTAHYDSVSYSQGVYDNATGSTCIYELLAYFNEHKPLRTLKFIWCGSEEMGLLGSKAYCEQNKDNLESYKLCINVDMIGCTIGEDIACCSSNISLVNYIKYLSCETGFAISPRQGVYSSDSTPFADKGIPSVSFARLAPQGGAKIHSHDDVIDYLEPINYYKTCKFIEIFADRLINSVIIPVEKEIPDNVKNDLDIYLGRKEKN